MWSLEVMKYRNEAYAAGLNATEVNFLSENLITPFSRKLDAESAQRIDSFKEYLNEKREE